MALIVKYKFNNTLADNIPTFNSEFIYTYEDVVEEDVTTRSIYSDSSPTKMQFGQDYNASNDNPTNKSLSLLEVLDLNVSSLTTCRNMFRKCENVSKIDTTNFSVSDVTDMSSMFHGCSQLTQLDVSNWNTSKVANMYGMFCDCSRLTQLDVSKWDTSSVTNMSDMFNDCSRLTQLDVSNFDTSNVTNMSYMFNSCSQLKKIKILNQQTLSRLIEYLPTKSDIGYIFTNCQVPENDKNWIAYNLRNFKTIFRLPQPLRRVGNIYDRLYWDYNKRHYCIEKNIDESYNVLETPQIIDLNIKMKSTMSFEGNTVFNTSINTRIDLLSLIYREKPTKLEPSKTYTLRFRTIDVEIVTIDLGGRIIEVNPIDNKVDIQITTLGELTNEYLSIYGENGIITDVMLFEGVNIGNVNYINNIESIGKLQEDGSYKIVLMTSPHILKGGK